MRLETQHALRGHKLAAMMHLVLLSANPLDDIHNTTRVAAVIIRGRVVWP